MASNEMYPIVLYNIKLHYLHIKDKRKHKNLEGGGHYWDVNLCSFELNRMYHIGIFQS